MPLLALLLGWWLLRGHRESHRSGSSECPPDYFKGLNYLLNEQPDKALEVFSTLLDADSDSIETYFALGGLFRRRGEVEKAIQIHQNLIARPSLDPSQRSRGLMALGQDYMKAGWLDRAETLFRELLNDSEFGPEAMRLLMDIYQREKEWTAAIEMAEKLGRKGQDMRVVIANLYCERAEETASAGSLRHARDLAEKALKVDAGSVRASLLLGRLQQQLGQHRQAIRHFRRVASQDAAYLSEVLQPLQESFAALGKSGSLIRLLERWVRQEAENPRLVPVLVYLLMTEQRYEEAHAYLQDALAQQPSVGLMQAMIQLHDQHPEVAEGELIRHLRRLLMALQAEAMPYHCSRCGFTSHQLYWQCPSCHSWSTIKPRFGIAQA